MNSIHHILYALLVKDGVPNLRNEDVEIVETNDTPPPVPEAPSRIPYATPIHEEEEDDTQSIHKSKYIEVIRIIIVNITCFYWMFLGHNIVSLNVVLEFPTPMFLSISFQFTDSCFENK